MKIVNILGGLGNQMFQYAFAIALKSEFTNEIVKINTNYYNGYPLHNGFELDCIFNIDLPRASKRDLFAYGWPIPHYRFWQIGKHILHRRSGMVFDTDFENDSFSYLKVANKNYFDGYWQSTDYFGKYRQEVKNVFTFPDIKDPYNTSAIAWINETKTAFIHIRRGDYINHPLLGGICTLDYYKKGIQVLQDKGFDRFIIFSNDIEWCRHNLFNSSFHLPTMYVDWNCGKDSFRDIQLMTLCKGALIANSSFSWWGAWLGEMEVVLCPEKWTNSPELLNNIYPDNWIKIPR